jgi:hypothetical protein
MWEKKTYLFISVLPGWHIPRTDIVMVLTANHRRSALHLHRCPFSCLSSLSLRVGHDDNKHSHRSMYKSLVGYVPYGRRNDTPSLLCRVSTAGRHSDKCAKNWTQYNEPADTTISPQNRGRRVYRVLCEKLANRKWQRCLPDKWVVNATSLNTRDSSLRHIYWQSVGNAVSGQC